MTSTTVQISKTIRVGDGEPLLLIAGPCQLESYNHSIMIASTVQKLCSKFNINFAFKASYDKANRTSLAGQRGIGLEEGLRILEKIRKELDVPVVTDVHSPEEADFAGAVVDVVQTPAFLCRQTDLLLAAGNTKKTVHIKKGQFLAPEDMTYAAEKIASTGNTNILLCERGTCFGYRDLVVDMRSLVIMKRLGYPVIFDATHSVMSMGGSKGASGGHREFIEPLTIAASGVGIDGLFIECHEDPACAPSDSASMLPLAQLEPLLEKACAVRAALKEKQA